MIINSNSNFNLAPQLEQSCFFIKDWALSKVLLKNTVHFPWLILVPRKNNIKELWQLSQEERHVLIDEIARASKIMEELFKPEKLNVATLGNVVSQLHVHIIARFTTDALWPFAVWQQSAPSDEPYIDHELLIKELKDLL